MTDDELLRQLASEADRAYDAGEIVQKLTEKAKSGDADSIRLLTELGQRAKEVKLRKELFGV